MDYFALAVVALIQGITEFLPVSSSAHLILVPYVTGWPDQGLEIDVAAHFGSLLAVMVYFRRDLAAMLGALRAQFSGHGMNPEARLAWFVVAGTVPVVLVGLIGYSTIKAHFRAPEIIAASTILFGIFLLVADRYSRFERDVDSLTLRDVALIGLAQACALIPGASRSGVTIAAALALGLSREAATRISFLMAIPVIFLASGRASLELYLQGNSVPAVQVLFVVAVSALSAYVCIHLFIKFVERVGMLPFVVYRLILGLALFGAAL